MPVEVLVCCGCKFTMPYSQERSGLFHVPQGMTMIPRTRSCF